VVAYGLRGRVNKCLRGRGVVVASAALTSGNPSHCGSFADMPQTLAGNDTLIKHQPVGIPDRAISRSYGRSPRHKSPAWVS
jgi:hypothetical protein